MTADEYIKKLEEIVDKKPKAPSHLPEHLLRRAISACPTCGTVNDLTIPARYAERLELVCLAMRVKEFPVGSLAYLVDGAAVIAIICERCYNPLPKGTLYPSTDLRKVPVTEKPNVANIVTLFVRV